MSSELIHRQPCPQHWQAAPTWPRRCGCPEGWPKYADDIARQAAAIICDKQPKSTGPRLLLTFTLHDGTQRSTTCDLYEALRQLAEAKSYPRLWKDFKIETAKETI